jgi:hypothetical protein
MTYLLLTVGYSDLTLSLLGSICTLRSIKVVVVVFKHRWVPLCLVKSTLSDMSIATLACLLRKPFPFNKSQGCLFFVSEMGFL